MIKVFYSGYGYALRTKKDNYIDSQLKDETLNEYHAWFCIDHEIVERLKHFDSYALHKLRFIEGNLPRAITQEQALGSKFAITNRSGSWHSQFRLEQGKIEYIDRIGNQLKIFWNDDYPAPQPATVSSEETPIIGKYQERNNDFMAWLESENPPLAKMTKEQIHARLIARNSQLWTSGFKDWWEQQDIYKASRGRKKTMPEFTSTTE